MIDCFKPTAFYRHNRPLRGMMFESQAWFCTRDLGRLMGTGMLDRKIAKLDPDQRRAAWLDSDGQWRKTTIVSESAVFALLVHHYAPENRALRYWLSHEVIPLLHEDRHGHLTQAPRVDQMRFGSGVVGVLQWRNEPWVRVRDLPEVLGAGTD